MHFHSIDYLLFLPLVVAVAFALPHRYRWVWLLAASYFFYGYWQWSYTALILFSTAATFWIALRMDNSESEVVRKRWLWAGLAVDVGLLGSFQILQLFYRQCASGAPCGWAIGRARLASRGVATRRHFVLHLSIHQLYYRCVPPHVSRRTTFRLLRALHFVFPPIGCRPYPKRPVACCPN